MQVFRIDLIDLIELFIQDYEYVIESDKNLLICEHEAVLE